MAKDKKTVFEWGGKRFSDVDGLREILSCGYFREGNAWGSVRSGWQVVLEWGQVWPLLVRSSGSQMGAYPAAGLGGSRMARIPEPIKQGDLKSEGSRLWLAMWASGFVDAAPELWALCEAWEIGQGAGSGASAKKSAAGKGKGGSKAQVAAAGPRRL